MHLQGESINHPLGGAPFNLGSLSRCCGHRRFRAAQAAELWEKIRAEKTASEEAHEQFMQSLPQGMSILPSPQGLGLFFHL